MRFLKSYPKFLLEAVGAMIMRFLTTIVNISFKITRETERGKI